MQRGSSSPTKGIPRPRGDFARRLHQERGQESLKGTPLEGAKIRLGGTAAVYKDMHFFPIQYDDLNVVESFGPNSRITFPYRNVERLRDRPESTWTTDARVTYVYHLFPNVMFATFPDLVLLVVIDPVDVANSVVTVYSMVTPEVARKVSSARARDVNAEPVAQSAHRGCIGGQRNV